MTENWASCHGTGQCVELRDVSGTELHILRHHLIRHSRDRASHLTVLQLRTNV